MKVMFDIVKRLSRFMQWIAGVAIASIVVLTVCDVILRRLRMPIPFAFETVVLLGAIAISFSIPQTTLDKGHVFMDFIIEKMSKRWQIVLFIVSRCLGIGMFAVFAWRMFMLGSSYRRVGEVTPILQWPIYPVTYCVAGCFVLECFVLFLALVPKAAEARP